MDDALKVALLELIEIDHLVWEKTKPLINKGYIRKAICHAIAYMAEYNRNASDDSMCSIMAFRFTLDGLDFVYKNNPSNNDKCVTICQYPEFESYRELSKAIFAVQTELPKMYFSFPYCDVDNDDSLSEEEMLQYLRNGLVSFMDDAQTEMSVLNDLTNGYVSHSEYFVVLHIANHSITKFSKELEELVGEDLFEDFPHPVTSSDST